MKRSETVAQPPLARLSRWRWAAVTGLLALALLSLAGCHRRTPPAPPVVVTVPIVETRIVEVTREVWVTPTPTPTPMYASPINAVPGVLTYPLAEAPRYLDPQAAASAVETLLVRQLYEGLFSLRADGAVAPGAATSAIPSADGRVYTVTLRTGLSWSDGAPLRAVDFVAGFCRALEPAVGSPWAHLVRTAAPVTGAAAYAAGELADCNAVGLVALDDATLRISLDAPSAILPSLMTTGLFLPAPRNSGLITQTTIITGAVGMPVTGPFTLAERTSGRVLLVKNPAYWDAASVKVAQVELPVVAEPLRQWAGYLAGDLQAVAFPVGITPGLLDDPALARELVTFDGSGVSYLAFNTRRPPTDNPLVRRAIASTIDRARLAAAMSDVSPAWPAARLIPPALRDGVEQGDLGIPYDLAEARNLLAEAGYGPEYPVPPLELWINREGGNEALFKAVAVMLEAADIPVRLVSSSWEVYAARLQACRGDAAQGDCTDHLYRMGWVADYPDASSLLRTFGAGWGDQFTGWESVQYDALLQAGLAASDPVQRQARYEEAERLLLNEEAVLVPLLYYQRPVFVKRGVTAAYAPYGVPLFQYWRLRE